MSTFCCNTALTTALYIVPGLFPATYSVTCFQSIWLKIDSETRFSSIAEIDGTLGALGLRFLKSEVFALEELGGSGKRYLRMEGLMVISLFFCAASAALRLRCRPAEGEVSASVRECLRERLGSEGVASGVGGSCVFRMEALMRSTALTSMSP